MPLNNELNDECKLERIPEKIDSIEGNSYTTAVFQVKYSELDINMHANNANYIKWAMDSYPLDQRINERVESIEVNFLTEALPGDELKVTVTETDNGKYVHKILRASDNHELCRLRVCWKS